MILLKIHLRTELIDTLPLLLPRVWNVPGTTSAFAGPGKNEKELPYLLTGTAGKEMITDFNPQQFKQPWWHLKGNAVIKENQYWSQTKRLHFTLERRNRVDCHEQEDSWKYLVKGNDHTQSQWSLYKTSRKQRDNSSYWYTTAM